MRAVIVGVICMAFLNVGPGAARDIRQEVVRFKKSATVQDRIKGYQSVDYQMNAKAGQVLAVTLKPSNQSAYFNVLPPESNDVAMFVGSSSGNHFENVLTTDGAYTIRMYLMRSAARRNEVSDYTLNIRVEGKALEAIAASIDALLPGTPFHASANITCVPFLESKMQVCEAFVIRRGFDGTATVEVRPAKGPKRHILFVGGAPVASDSIAPMTFTRKEDLTIVNFGNDERYEIPDPLIVGG